MPHFAKLYQLRVLAHARHDGGRRPGAGDVHEGLAWFLLISAGDELPRLDLPDSAQHLSYLADRAEGDRRDRCRRRDSAEPATQATPESILMARVELEAIQQALESLPVHYREVILLCDLEEMSYQEIGQTLSIPIGTVMSRLFRARKAMRSLLSTKAEGARSMNCEPWRDKLDAYVDGASATSPAWRSICVRVLPVRLRVSEPYATQARDPRRGCALHAVAGLSRCACEKSIRRETQTGLAFPAGFRASPWRSCSSAPCSVSAGPLVSPRDPASRPSSNSSICMWPRSRAPIPSTSSRPIVTRSSRGSRASFRSRSTCRNWPTRPTSCSEANSSTSTISRLHSYCSSCASMSSPSSSRRSRRRILHR